MGAAAGAGGHIGITTFGEQDARWQAVDDVFTPYLPQGLAGVSMLP